MKLSDNIETDFDSGDYHLLVNFKILENFVLANTNCVECNSSKMTPTNDNNSRMGFASKLILKCISCKWKNYMFTSIEVTQPAKKQDSKMFEVSVRSIIAFREIGSGHEHILNYARLMNMQEISNSSFTNVNNALFEAYEKAADLST